MVAAAGPLLQVAACGGGFRGDLGGGRPTHRYRLLELRQESRSGRIELREHIVVRNQRIDRQLHVEHPGSRRFTTVGSGTCADRHSEFTDPWRSPGRVDRDVDKARRTDSARASNRHERRRTARVHTGRIMKRHGNLKLHRCRLPFSHVDRLWCGLSVQAGRQLRPSTDRQLYRDGARHPLRDRTSPTTQSRSRSKNRPCPVGPRVRAPRPAPRQPSLNFRPSRSRSPPRPRTPERRRVSGPTGCRLSDGRAAPGRPRVGRRARWPRSASVPVVTAGGLRRRNRLPASQRPQPCREGSRQASSPSPTSWTVLAPNHLTHGDLSPVVDRPGSARMERGLPGTACVAILPKRRPLLGVEFDCWFKSCSKARRRPGVGGHEIVPGGGHVAARWWPTVLPSGGRLFCPR